MSSKEIIAVLIIVILAAIAFTVITGFYIPSSSNIAGAAYATVNKKNCNNPSFFNSDGGDNILKKGYTQYYELRNNICYKITNTEVCKDSSLVMEAVDKIFEKRNCPSGYACSNGACILKAKKSSSTSKAPLANTSVPTAPASVNNTVVANQPVPTNNPYRILPIEMP